MYFFVLALAFFEEKNMTGVGFEPTPPKRLVPKTSALDHSANQSNMNNNKITPTHFEKKYKKKNYK